MLTGVTAACILLTMGTMAEKINDIQRNHSEQLCQLIYKEIQLAGGNISFRRYMEMALYEPHYGYYSSGTTKIGEGGDFITAPEISPIFSICLANQCMQVLQLKGLNTILELGAGTGTMAVDILLQMESQGALPDHYYILEVSPDLVQRQRRTVERRAGHLLGRITWLVTLDELHFSGVIIANEVLDAMPVERFALTEQGVMRRSVCKASTESVDPFSWRNTPADQQMTQTVEGLFDGDFVVGYTSEYNPALQSWMKVLDRCLDSGALVLIDYGYTGKDYYHPSRSEGTLICHFQHQYSDNPFLYPGLVDISASVDFTAVAGAAVAAGFDLNGYTSQSHFLMANDLQTAYETLFSALSEPAETKSMIELANQVKKLTLPSEMGERFQVIGLTKGVDFLLRGFSQVDLSHKL